MSAMSLPVLGWERFGSLYVSWRAREKDNKANGCEGQRCPFSDNPVSAFKQKGQGN